MYKIEDVDIAWLYGDIRFSDRPVDELRKILKETWAAAYAKGWQDGRNNLDPAAAAAAAANPYSEGKDT